MEDPTSFRAFRDCTRDALAHIPLHGLQDPRFVKPGEAVDFVRHGHMRPGGGLPMNADGGRLLYRHAGHCGTVATREAVRRPQGRAAAQVEGAKASFVQGIGRMSGSAGPPIPGVRPRAADMSGAVPRRRGAAPRAYRPWKPSRRRAERASCAAVSSRFIRPSSRHQA